MTTTLHLPKKLSEQYKIESAKLRKVAEDFPWEIKEAYGMYLAQSFYYARESTRILALASAKFDLDHNDLHYRFLKHANEERGHENLLLSDLKHLDLDINNFPELPQMGVFYHNLYYWIEHVNPVALFGWVLNLEGFAVDCGDYLYNRLLKAYGKSSTAFLKVHAHEDLDHMDKALAFMQKLPPEKVEWVSKNYAECSFLYRDVLTTIMQTINKDSKKVA